jgi:hypothetical protein
MSKYRCPICGATHKSEVAQCRLCGQSMAPNAIPAYSQEVAQEIHTDKSIKGVALIGLAVVAAIVVGAVIFGVIHPTKQIAVASDFVTGDKHDGWTTATSDAGKFVVDLPGDVTKESVDLPITDTGKVTGVTTYVPLKAGADTYLLVGSGPITLPSTTTGSGMSAAAARNYLKDTIVPKWLAANNLELLEVQVQETTVAGYPALSFTTLAPKAKLQNKDAFAQVTLVLQGSTIYVIQTISVFKDAEQQAHMVGTFGITG